MVLSLCPFQIYDLQNLPERQVMAGRQPESIEDLRIKIMAQIAQLSALLGEMPDDDERVRDARNAFLQLSTLIGRALDMNLQ